MSWTLLVMGHGRTDYFRQTIESIGETIGWDFFDRHIVATDGCSVTADFRSSYWWKNVYTEVGTRHGLTANMAQAFDALGDDEWVFWVEEDFLIHDAPLDEMRATLEANPTVANMVLVRQPWGQHEIAAGSVLAAQPYELLDRGTWLQHHGGFWLNPFVAHSSTLRQLVPGVEQSLTKQCLRLGLSFGYWGSVTDPPRCTHIGAQGGMGSPGWLP